MKKQNKKKIKDKEIGIKKVILPEWEMREIEKDKKEIFKELGIDRIRSGEDLIRITRHLVPDQNSRLYSKSLETLILELYEALKNTHKDYKIWIEILKEQKDKILSNLDKKTRKDILTKLENETKQEILKHIKKSIEERMSHYIF